MSVLKLIKKIYKAILPYNLRIYIRFHSDYYKHRWHYQYSKFFIRYRYTLSNSPEHIKKRISSFTKNPLISIVIPSNADKKLLEVSLQSLEKQFYTHYEILLGVRPENLAATEQITRKYQLTSVRFIEQQKADLAFLFEKAQGEYVGLLQSGDILTEDCLYEVTRLVLTRTPDFIYSDNDLFRKAGKFILPNFKPDYSPDTLLAQNYIGNFSIFKNSFSQKILANRKISNNTLYEFILLAVENTTDIAHIPVVLYHQRVSTESAEDQAVQKKAIQEALTRRAVRAEVLKTTYPTIFRIKRSLTNTPLVSIMTPFKDKVELLKTCLDSILQLSTYTNFEFIGISNNSTEAETFAFMKEYSAKDNRIKFYEHNIPFNFSSLNNHAAKRSNGEHLILLNNDIEIISPDWIESLLEYSQLPETGAVGAKLYFPNNKVQHAGILVGNTSIAQTSHKMYDRRDEGFNYRLQVTQNISAVTAACFMVKKSSYFEIDGLDEKNLAVAFNDVDFCLRLMEKGYKNIFTPYCEAYHHESISRGLENTPEKKLRLEREADYMKVRHQKILSEGDPFYNPNLTEVYEDFSIRVRS